MEFNFLRDKDRKIVKAMKSKYLEFFFKNPLPKKFSTLRLSSHRFDNILRILKKFQIKVGISSSKIFLNEHNLHSVTFNAAIDSKRYTPKFRFNRKNRRSTSFSLFNVLLVSLGENISQRWSIRLSLPPRVVNNRRERAKRRLKLI